MSAVAFVLLASGAGAFVPPPCTEDPSRVIFAGLGNGPCKKFHGDQTSCESAYYLNRDAEAVSCDYVEGTCVGCGGENLACAMNTCNGRPNGVSTATCSGDPDRTALLGAGDNGSERCRSLDATDQITCENAFYDPGDDDDDGSFRYSVACFWDSLHGSCVGCGDNGSACPFNDCDPTLEPPTAVCPLDPSRTNLLGYGGNDSRRCRSLDDTDQATCESAYYEDERTGNPVACWWDGNDCRGSGFDDYFAWNTCLSPAAPPPAASATCPLEPDRTLLGYGRNDTGPCRAMDETDQATCENAYYEDVESGAGVACWWDGEDCRGSSRDHREKNACQIPMPTADAVCADARTNLLGFGHNDTRPCRQLDDTSEAVCENAFYQDASRGAPVACGWSDGECRGCNGRACTENPCVEPTCAGDETRTNFVGIGDSNRGLGRSGGACRQYDGDQENCEISFYFSVGRGSGVACWWDGGICRGSTDNFRAQDVCRVDAACTREPGRTHLGIGGNGTAPCRVHDGDQISCEDSFYEDSGGRPIACWWAPGDLCLGSRGRNELQNACLREPVAAAATCPGDLTRDSLIGFGRNHTGGDKGAACRLFDGTDVETCEDAYYQDIVTHAGVACWWDNGAAECRGSARRFSVHNACDPRQIPCTFAPERETYLGLDLGEDDPCSQLDSEEGGDQEMCEDAFYGNTDGAPTAVSCWWNGNDCNGADDNDLFRNECFYEVPPAHSSVTCGDRTALLGFGNDGSAPCHQLDGGERAVCENAFYEDDDDGYAVACWWDDDAEDPPLCRGSSDNYAENNTCPPPDAPCFGDPGRTNVLGFGNNNTSPCGQFDAEDGGDPEMCENAFYVDDDDGFAVACWWDDDEADPPLCRGSAEMFSAQNVCQTRPVPDAMCEGRDNLIGFGDNNSNACRQFDGEAGGTKEDCENAFYVNQDDLRPIACIWSEGAELCTGTTRWPALNACDPSAAPPPCGARTLLGKGDRNGIGANGGACRLFDDETMCEEAYYLNRDGQAVACWWDGFCRGSGGGSNGDDPSRLNNVCVPEVPCADRNIEIGFGANNSHACRLFDGDETSCQDAYYIRAGLAAVACQYDSGSGNCLGCGRGSGRGTCTVNECGPQECPGDPGRTLVSACRQVNSMLECENSWHVTSQEDLSAIAAACVWSEERGCFGCGPFSQSRRECANACETACGNGVLDGGETCDDGNMFPGDCCDSTCQLEADGSTCTDRLFCTQGPGTCLAGVCTGAVPRPCSSCLTNDCSETDNSCADGGESGPAVAAPLAALQGEAPAPPDMSRPLPPGTDCDDGIPGTDSVCNEIGLCVGQLTVPTSTPTATPTSTPTGTPTSAPTTTPTPVPVGGACADTSQCVDVAICLEGICTVVAAPAPAASDRGLLAIVAALLAVAALNLERRRRRS